MMSMLKEWNGQIEIDGVIYEKGAKMPVIAPNAPFKVVLHSASHKAPQTGEESPKKGAESPQKAPETGQGGNTSPARYKITVKAYMTRKSSPDFDFMAKWNNDKPMPLRTMEGYIEKETRGMVYMHLKGLAIPTINCLCCGKELTHPVSRFYGIGPVCLSKIGIAADIDDVESIKEQLVNVEWEGWVIKSAIVEQEEV